MLADLQAAVRDVMTGGEPTGLDGRLVGGAHPRHRLSIHRRHYATSLVAAVVSRFPATHWLLGSDTFTTAAAACVDAHPPDRPCIAEYAGAFPDFLRTWPAVAHLAYVPAFARLEWHLGALALCVDQPPVPVLPTEAGSSALTLQLQEGVRYLALDWPVDILIGGFLDETLPEQFAMAPITEWLELRGDRGALRMQRLTAGRYAFRHALALGTPLGDAMLVALAADDTFAPGDELGALLADGLVTGCMPGLLEVR